MTTLESDPEDGAAGLRRLEVGELRFVIIDAPPLRVPEAVSLSPSEREVLELLYAGQTTAEIAAARQTSARTISNQLGRIYRKFAVNSRTELVALLASAPGPDTRG